MRILTITNLYPTPVQPNRATFNRHQLRLLSQRHPVRVVTPISWTDELAARRKGLWKMPAGRRGVQDGIPVEYPRFVFPPRIARRWYGHCLLASIRRTVRRAVAEFRPDVLFAPWAYPDGWAAVRLGRELGLPAVIQCHGSDVLLLDQYPDRKRQTIDAVTAADGVVAVSQDIAHRLETFGVPSDRVKVIYDGVDLDLFRPGPKAEARTELGLPADQSLVLFVGNLVPVKAVDVLLAACGELVRQGTPVLLLVIGDGPLRPRLQDEAKRLQIENRVRFLGTRPHAELPVWLRAADVLVLPSHSEGVPNVLLEAAACGTPWVASQVGGIPEIAHLGVGRMVTPNTPPELAAAIRESLAGRTSSASPTRPRSRMEAVAELESFLTDRHTAFHSGTAASAGEGR